MQVHCTVVAEQPKQIVERKAVAHSGPNANPDRATAATPGDARPASATREPLTEPLRQRPGGDPRERTGPQAR
jgi:hypothetical protein